MPPLVRPDQAPPALAPGGEHDLAEGGTGGEAAEAEREGDQPAGAEERRPRRACRRRPTPASAGGVARVSADALRQGSTGATAMRNSRARPRGIAIVSKNGSPTVMRSPLTASTRSGNTVPSSTTKAKAANRRLLSQEAPSRLTAASMRPGVRKRSPRQAMSPQVTSDDQAKKPSSNGPISESLNACTESSTPERVRKVPRIVRAKVAHTSARFHTRSIPRRSCTITECRKAVPVSHGRKLAFSTGSHAQ